MLLFKHAVIVGRYIFLMLNKKEKQQFRSQLDQTYRNSIFEIFVLVFFCLCGLRLNCKLQ